MLMGGGKYSHYQPIILFLILNCKLCKEYFLLQSFFVTDFFNNSTTGKPLILYETDLQLFPKKARERAETF